MRKAGGHSVYAHEDLPEIQHAQFAQCPECAHTGVGDVGLGKVQKLQRRQRLGNEIDSVVIHRVVLAEVEVSQPVASGKRRSAVS